MSGARVKTVAAAILLLAQIAGALRVSPGVATVRGIPVGVDTSLGIPLTCYNDSDIDVVITVEVVKPSGVIKKWREGYDEIPDPGWFYVVGDTPFVVPAQGQISLPIRIHIPDSEAYYNQMWAAYILVTSRGGGMFNTAVAPLFMLETKTLKNPAVPPAGKIATAPSAVELNPKSPDAKIWIYNNSDSAVELDISPYVPSGEKPEIEATTGWKYDPKFAEKIKVGKRHIKIKPHGKRAIKVRAKHFPPKNAEALIKISGGEITKFVRIFWKAR
ncbi:hypothetical protein J7K99_02815 [bacterium]|nr:hypothetical protein [bacterium]